MGAGGFLIDQERTVHAAAVRRKLLAKDPVARALIDKAVIGPRHQPATVRQGRNAGLVLSVLGRLIDENLAADRNARGIVPLLIDCVAAAIAA